MKTDPWAVDEVYADISDLLPVHSPSGTERMMDQKIRSWPLPNGREFSADAASNLILEIPGPQGGRRCAVTAHKDEIGAYVKTVRRDGTLTLKPVGGWYPWVYGEGPV